MWSSAGVRDKRKARGFVTVVMRPVATSLEANVAGNQMNDAEREVCTVAKCMSAVCCAFLKTCQSRTLSDFFHDAPLNPAAAGHGPSKRAILQLSTEIPLPRLSMITSRHFPVLNFEVLEDSRAT